MGQKASRLPNSAFRFDGFEANRESYCLRREGRKVRLERIPLELLFLLLERSGKLVEREDIVARLWRDTSFMDTERSINTAIRKIRKALGDNPNYPKFIETVVGKGYRFVAPVILESKPGENHGGLDAARAEPANSGEIRLREFSVDTTGITPVLTCGVAVGKIDLGRIPLIEIELPADVTLPLEPKDRLLLALHGIRVSLTSKAVQALHAFSISTLQCGLRTRGSDHFPLAEESPAEPHCTTARPPYLTQFNETPEEDEHSN